MNLSFGQFHNKHWYYFTGEKNSSPAEIIQVTMGLLLSSILQAIGELKTLPVVTKKIILAPSLQKLVVSVWFEVQPQRMKDYTKEIVEGFKDVEWINKKSI